MKKILVKYPLVALLAGSSCLQGALFSDEIQTDMIAYPNDFLTMQDCVELALENNRTLQIAETKIKHAMAEKNEIRSAFMPHVTLEGIYDNNSHSLNDDLTQFQDFNSSTALGLSVKVGLWDFGSSLNHFKASRARIDASKMQKQFAVLTVEEQVKTTYLKILEKEKSLEVVESSIATLKQQFSTSDDLFKQGIVNNTDVLSVQVRLAEEEKRLLQIKNDISNQRMALNHLIGLPLFQEVRLKNIQEQPCSFDYQNALDYALKNRPDLSAMNKYLEALLLDKRGTRLSIAPKFYAFGNGNVSTERAAASVGIGMTMPLYEGGTREAQVEKLRSDVDGMKASIADLKEIIAIEIKNTFLHLEEIKQSLTIDKKAISLAEENLKNTMKLYQEGYSSINDMLISQGQLNVVKMNYYSNLYRSHMACVHLLTITGGFSLNHYGSLE